MYEVFEWYAWSGRMVRRVRIAGSGVYPLVTRGGQPLSEFSPRQRRLVLDGAYGQPARLYALACAEEGVPCRLGWRGVTNALGDHAEVTLPEAFMVLA